MDLYMTGKFFKRTFISESIVVGLCVSLFVTAAILTSGFERSGGNVSAEEANRQLHQNFLLPPTANDINYVSSVWFSAANFAISETEFVRWCQSRGWRTTSITPDDLGLYQRIFGRERQTKIIHDGLKFGAMSGDRGFNGAFDRSLQRASVQYSGH